MHIHTSLSSTTVPFLTIQYSTVQYSTLQYSTLHYSAVHYTNIQYSTLQYTTVQCTHTTADNAAPFTGLLLTLLANASGDTTHTQVHSCGDCSLSTQYTGVY